MERKLGAWWIHVRHLQSLAHHLRGVRWEGCYLVGQEATVSAMELETQGELAIAPSSCQNKLSLSFL